jgi:hypothetical protein
MAQIFGFGIAAALSKYDANLLHSNIQTKGAFRKPTHGKRIALKRKKIRNAKAHVIYKRKLRAKAKKARK